MIVEMLMDMVSGLLDWLTSSLDIPALPDSVRTVIESSLQYITVGIEILANYTHLDYLLTLFGIVVAIDAALLIYKLIMWILRKIPMLGIS